MCIQKLKLSINLVMQNIKIDVKILIMRVVKETTSCSYDTEAIA